MSVTGIDKEEFAEDIECISSIMGISITDAIHFYCQREEIEIESVIPIIPESIKSKMYVEANNHNLLKKKTNILKRKN